MTTSNMGELLDRAAAALALLEAGGGLESAEQATAALEAVADLVSAPPSTGFVLATDREVTAYLEGHLRGGEYARLYLRRREVPR